MFFDGDWKPAGPVWALAVPMQEQRWQRDDVS